MDLASGYWQVKVEAAFVTHERFYQFWVMPFGLCNASATFERLMEWVLCGMRWSRCLVYLDDVISFGADAPDTLTHLTEVLECLSSFGLQLKAKKCTFMQTEVAFLGHIVGRAGLACDPVKLSAVRAWRVPVWLNKCANLLVLWDIISFHTKLCGVAGTSSGLNSQRVCFRVDLGNTGGI